MALLLALLALATPPEKRDDDAGLARDVDEFARRLEKEDRFSGVIVVARAGKPVFGKAYGYADREKKVPNDLETRFRIGSMNKMFTSVAIAQLVQAGKVAYTDSVAKVLPDYPDKEIARRVTIHHLLTHTSGLGDFFGPEFAKKKDTLHTLQDYLALFAGKPLRFEPGTSWTYSNAGMIVAGLVVERVSGESYFDYVRKHIYAPAGMKDSGTFDKTRPQPDQSIGYTKDEGKWVPNFDTLPLMGSSAGGGDSTGPDLVRFASALKSGKLVSPEFVALITTGKVDKYAYGFVDDQVAGARVVGHGGGAPGMNANLDIYWDTDTAVVVLANRDPPIANEINQFIRGRIRP